MSALICAPIVQRLRHVRLSNIDSIAMPGIANISRYEHVLGVCHLARSLRANVTLARPHALAIQAAALLHDWAITAFGHLVEEGFQYAGSAFRHEDQLNAIMMGATTGANVGGAELQILSGRETRLTEWAVDAVGADQASELLDLIRQTIMGEGPYGALVSGTMDLDNIDNVVRMAFHMGLEVDRTLPLRLAAAIVGVDGQGVRFQASAADDIQSWVDVRREVYSNLMLAQPDFSLKVMIVAATALALEAGDIAEGDWHLTDHGFLCRLEQSRVPAVREVAGRWTAGEAWDCTPLWWLQGSRPSPTDLRAFSLELTERLGRHCFAYGIKDKRQRELVFHFDDGGTRSFGVKPTSWLLGVASSRRSAFARGELEQVLAAARARFDCGDMDAAVTRASDRAVEPLLF